MNQSTDPAQRRARTGGRALRLAVSRTQLRARRPRQIKEVDRLQDRADRKCGRGSAVQLLVLDVEHRLACRGPASQTGCGEVALAVLEALLIDCEVEPRP